MRDRSPETNYERLAVIALYHRDVLGKGNIHKDDFPEWFEKAGQPVPKNLPRDIRKAQRKSLIGEASSEEDCYFPTRTAEQKLSGSNG